MENGFGEEVRRCHSNLGRGWQAMVGLGQEIAMERAELFLLGM